MQSGYAGGLLLICPLGDMLRRRPFILSLIGITAAMVSPSQVPSHDMIAPHPAPPLPTFPPSLPALANPTRPPKQWLGLCVTHSFTAFQALSFLCGLTTVTPQLMLPLVGDLAPADRKASSLSIVVSGLMGGMLVARLLSGVVANYADWRVIYWVAFGLQWALFAALWGFMPDYPASDDESVALSREGSPTRRVGAAAALYARMLASIAVLLLTKPLLLQACAVSFLLSFVFTSFWTTLTFLLASPPFEYPSFAIGLFALAGLVGIGLGPVFGRVVIDRFVPLFSALVGQAIALIGIVVGTFAGPSTVAGSVIEAVGIDLGAVLAQTANRAAIYTIDRGSINRINTAYMVCAFCGQLTGTAVGNRLYAQGGWRWSGGASIGAMGLSVLICVVRGPKETGWVGWHGGWGIRRDRKGGAGGGVEKAETGGADAAVTQVTGDANMTVTGEDSRADVEKGAQR